MAGDWIVWTKGLSRKAKVLAIARGAGITRQDAVVALMEFWEWADGETEDGKLPGLNIGDLIIALPGTTEAFWLSLVRSDWLRTCADGLDIPEFMRWMGKSAKSRMKKNQRQAEWRKDHVDVPVDGASSTRASPKASTRDTEQKSNSFSAKTPNRKERKQDELFDAVAEVTASDPHVSGSHIGRVCKALRSADPPYTPDEVRRLPAAIAANGMSFTLTLGAIEKYIGLVRGQPKKAGVETKTPRDYAAKAAASRAADAAERAAAVPPPRRKEV